MLGYERRTGCGTWRLTFNVQNLFDDDPPIIASTGGGRFGAQITSNNTTCGADVTKSVSAWSCDGVIVGRRTKRGAALRSPFASQRLPNQQAAYRGAGGYRSAFSAPARPFDNRYAS